MLAVRWFGHSMWKIWNEDVSIVTDPFTEIGYPLPRNLKADIVLSSHDHFDHNNFSLISGAYEAVKEPGRFNIRGVSIEAFATCHDECKGAARGSNLLMKFELSGKVFLHCGDLGHDLSAEMTARLGRIDVLFIPVGGHFTIDAATAQKIVDKLHPRIVFPMHYKTDVLDFPIAGADEYLKLISNFRRIGSNSVELTDSDFDNSQTIILNFR